MKRRAAVSAALALAAPATLWCAPSFAACEDRPGAMRAVSPAAVVLFAPQPAPIKVGELFALDLEICVARGSVRGVAVDASMPEHKHGMNYQPVVKKSAGNAAGNTWSATGLMFHMPGRWQFVFEVDTGTGRERVLHNLTVE